MPKAKTDEVWEARIRFWPGDIERHMLVVIYYAWRDGRVQFYRLLTPRETPFGLIAVTNLS